MDQVSMWLFIRLQLVALHTLQAYMVKTIRNSVTKHKLACMCSTHSTAYYYTNVKKGRKPLTMTKVYTITVSLASTHEMELITGTLV